MQGCRVLTCCFNSMIVRLKGTNNENNSNNNNRFNSMIVRLKDSAVNWLRLVQKFQFYDSPIKRHASRPAEGGNVGFNSMIVRLKADTLL